MTPDELHPILTAYRTRIQPAWSKATAHPSFEGADGSPVGQCGVTSAWLQQRLREDHEIAAWYCIGAVRIHNRVIQSGHCWLEIGEDRTRLIADLTAGQVQYLSNFEILFAPYWELRQDGIAYLPRIRKTIEQLLSDPVADRLALLESALA